MIMQAEIKCPRCKSTNYSKKRVDNRKTIEKVQRYLCKNCKRSYTLNSIYPIPTLAEPAEVKCTYCESSDTVKCGQLTQRKNGYLVQKCRCKSCKKYFTQGNRKREEIYLKGKLIYSYWNPPGLQYTNYQCPSCHSTNSILRSQYRDNREKKDIIESLCLDCALRFKGEGRPWTNIVRSRFDQEIPVVPINFQSDKWDLRNFYPNSDKLSQSYISVNFSGCGELWFKNLIKEYVLFKIEKGASEGTVYQNMLSRLSPLGKYLEEIKINSLAKLSRILLNDFFCLKEII